MDDQHKKTFATLAIEMNALKVRDVQTEDLKHGFAFLLRQSNWMCDESRKSRQNSLEQPPEELSLSISGEDTFSK